MTEKITTTSYGIVGDKPWIIWKQLPNDVVLYFRGFRNETENPGEESECQSWELEDWDEDVGIAYRFMTFSEAKAFYDVLNEKEKCGITLYAWNERVNVEGHHLYPLKQFITPTEND